MDDGDRLVDDDPSGGDGLVVEPDRTDAHPTDLTAADTAELAGALRTEVHRLAYHLRTPATRSGITPTRLAALAALARTDGIRQGDLAAQMGVTPASMTRLVDLLSRPGWVERRRDETDLRAHLLWLTDEGRAALASVRRESTSGLSADIDSLTPRQQQVLAAAVPILKELADRHLGDQAP